MAETLRIPVTAEQKRQITDAAKVNPSGLAAWARDVLLRASNEQMGTVGKTGQKGEPA